MAAYVLALIKVTNLVAEDVQRRYVPEHGVGQHAAKRAANGLARLGADLAGGTLAGAISALSVVAADGTVSTGAIACTRANAAGNYVRFTFGTLTITLTEGSGADFLRGADDTATGANLAVAINANAILKTIMTAVSVTGTITLTAKFPTAVPHMVAMSTDDATAFALTAFASGTQGTANFFLQGFQTGKTL
jgi:hypothetical protein